MLYNELIQLRGGNEDENENESKSENESENVSESEHEHEVKMSEQEKKESISMRLQIRFNEMMRDDIERGLVTCNHCAIDKDDVNRLRFIKKESLSCS
jgi:hypothetical protein